MVILRLENSTMFYSESNKNINGGKKEKIIVYCCFEIFILPETVHKDIPGDFQGGLYETTEVISGRRLVLPVVPASGGSPQDGLCLLIQSRQPQGHCSFSYPQQHPLCVERKR